MDRRVLHFDWNWQLYSDPEEIWPLISDTNRLNQELNLPPVQKADLSYNYMDGHCQLSYDSLKNSDAWEEEPYEWEHPFRFGVKRRYKNGFCREMKIQVDLLPNDLGTRVRYQIWALPRNFISMFTLPLKLNTLYRSRLKSALRHYDLLHRKGLASYELEYKKRLVRGGKRRLEELGDELANETGESKIVAKLLNYLVRSKDWEAAHIQPYALARYWNQPEQKVLSVFLHATKTGLLNFNWDLYCPDCRKIQHSCTTLSEVHEPVFCEECKKEFYINFNRTVQLSFRPNPLIRKLSDDRYCLTGPQTRPDIVIKQFLRKGEKRYLKTRLEVGTYYLRVKGVRGKARIKVTERGNDNITISLIQAGMNDEYVEISTEPNLIFENKTEKSLIFILEKEQWNRSGVTAARATSLQLFRDLFDKEVLRKGEKIAVDSQTLMFTDLLDSTSMYTREGDEEAVGQVIEHFDILQNAITEENGAIVKTIGDSVMAVFSNPSKAFRAFVKAHKLIKKNGRFNSSLKLKVGIHHGSCVAVNLNNKIDYFGSTVNIAARLVDFADEDEIILSQSVAENTEVVRMLESSELSYFSSKDITTSLRGFEGEQFLIKRIALDKPPLRLVI